MSALTLGIVLGAVAILILFAILLTRSSEMRGPHSSRRAAQFAAY